MYNHWFKAGMVEARRSNDFICYICNPLFDTHELRRNHSRTCNIHHHRDIPPYRNQGRISYREEMLVGVSAGRNRLCCAFAFHRLTGMVHGHWRDSLLLLLVHTRIVRAGETCRKRLVPEKRQKLTFIYKTDRIFR